MEVDLAPALRTLYTDSAAQAPCDTAVVRRFRFLVGLLFAAVTEADVTAFPRFRLRPLGSPHGDHYAVPLTPDWHLVLEFRKTGPHTVVGVLQLMATTPPRGGAYG